METARLCKPALRLDIIGCVKALRIIACVVLLSALLFSEKHFNPPPAAHAGKRGVRGHTRAAAEVAPKRRAVDQRQPRNVTLSDESAVAIDDHPFAVEGQAALANGRTLKRDSATALDGVYVQRGDARGHERASEWQ